MQAYFGDPVSERSSHAEKVKETLKESVDIWGHGYPNRMAEGEQRTELRMFQRRERKRDDDKTHNRDTSRPSSKSWKDYDASDRNFGRDDARWSGGSSYEVSKKPKDSMERPDKSWRERDSSEKRHKDGFHRERDDHGVNSSWHKSKGLHDRERNEYSHQNRDHRDRGDPSHPTHKDWKAKGYPRDKDYERGDRVHDSKDGSHKSRSVNANADAPERHSSHQVYTSKSDRSSHNHDCESPSHHRHLSSGRSSQVDQAHVENSSWNKNSSHHSSRGPDKSVDASNAVPGGDSRSIPKLKLKVGGITHTLNSEGRRQSEGGDSVARTSHQSGTSHKKRMSSAPEPNRRRQRLILQDDSDEDDDIPSSGKERTHASDEDGFLAYLAEEPVYHRGSGGIAHEGNQLSQGVRKSSRVPKKRVFDGDDDVEAEPKKKRKKKAELDSDEDLYRIEEDELEHGFAEEEEEELEMANDKMKLNKRRRKSLDVDLSVNDDRRVGLGAGKLGIPGESKGGVPLTARQRALQSSKEGLADVNSSFVEFPEGLTHSAPKKPKEVLTAAERQLKKEEAAQKRRQQVEKAAKEIQAVAIQKILCQDSQRKKREGKLQKQREEMEQEKKAAANAPASNSIRWVLGPNGNLVSFSQDLELPKIFSGPLSYPGERERCAGPSCTNAYKYRDSKTLLPLCSLQCYRAVQKKPSEPGLAH
ncbi:hypothetical protein KP509_09G007600 [Ceratopteris richardii]|nr:hypothetical protein KP509_09G007600 [Ceratopteris richardii]KAH7428582.1 hypothetical protein KP509_09G007600 [Ceratopteris richardii]